MFSNAEYSINRDLALAERHGAFDCIEDGHPILGSELESQVVGIGLVNIHRGKLEIGAGPTVLLPPLENLSDKNVGV